MVSCVVFEEILVQSGRKHLFFGLFFLHLGMKFSSSILLMSSLHNRKYNLCGHPEPKNAAMSRGRKSRPTTRWLPLLTALSNSGTQIKGISKS